MTTGIVAIRTASMSRRQCVIKHNFTANNRIFLRQRNVVDADRRGGWTQIFGGKASEPATSRPVEKRYFT